MKTLCLLLLVITGVTASANPRITSWFTKYSGQYARLYPTTTEEAAGPGSAVTTWNRGPGNQAQPTYAGVHEIAFNAASVYIRTTGLASHVMGPWYLDEARTNLFPAYPSNTETIYRFNLNAFSSDDKTATGLGAIGYFVDGVAMFDSRDAFSYDTSAGQDDNPMAGPGVVGDNVWNRDAFVNEAVTFDPANAHQAGTVYHYHANPTGLRHLLDDSVDYDPSSNTYSENFNGRHSPILGWVRDSYPIYGPYGYDQAEDASSGVRRMTSGYQKRDGTNGSTDLAATGRNSLPAWAVDVQGIGPALAANQLGPDVTSGAGSQFELGHYLEDYAYQGNLGLTQGVDFDLDLHNGRFCVTPEFPGGTYAYFTSIEADGAPSFPYNIGRTYYGIPTGATAPSIPASATVYFEGGPEVAEALQSVNVDGASGDVIVSWSAAQGGGYEVEASPDLENWSPAGNATATSATGSFTDPGRANTDDTFYYRATRTELAPFDDRGFEYDGGGQGGDVTFEALFPAQTPLPPQNAVTSVTVGGVRANITRYDRLGRRVTIEFDDSSLPRGAYPVILNFRPPGQLPQSVNSDNRYVVD